jgi:hypothetical protein
MFTMRQNITPSYLELSKVEISILITDNFTDVINDLYAQEITELVPQIIHDLSFPCFLSGNWLHLRRLSSLCDVTPSPFCFLKVHSYVSGILRPTWKCPIRVWNH